ncbi:MAG TPA: hypothetical protein VJB62_03610, partial [Patescibacteria group bacterium]|nr:hypothetical protein [Patescibacteria group bacterium]
MDMNIKNTTAVNIACPALEWQGLALTFNVKARPCHSNAGQAILTAVVFFMFVSMIVVSGAYTISYKESKSSR